MLDRSRRTMIGLLVATTLVVLSRTAEGSIYQHVGMGLCLPEYGDEYSYLLTEEVPQKPAMCSEACDNIIIDTDDGKRGYYRGFALVNRRHPDHSFRGGNCLCFFDCHNAPQLTPELEADWIFHEQDEDEHGEETHGEGRITGTDGAHLINCYEVIVDDPVTPDHHSVTDTIWQGYDNNQ
ncbi:hypothetical protein ACHAWF_009790 [Thalassiosira exigua]